MEALENEEKIVSNEIARMPGMVNWGTSTVIGVVGGMLYRGSKEASASVSKDAEVMLRLGSTPDKREKYRLMRDAMEKRFVRATRGSIVGVPGSLLWRVRNVMLGSVMGAAICFPLGWLQLKLVEKANERRSSAVSEIRKATKSKDGDHRAN